MKAWVASGVGGWEPWRGDNLWVTPSIPEGTGQEASLIHGSKLPRPKGADAEQAGTSDSLGTSVSFVTEGTALSCVVGRDPMIHVLAASVLIQGLSPRSGSCPDPERGDGKAWRPRLPLASRVTYLSCSSLW